MGKDLKHLGLLTLLVLVVFGKTLGHGFVWDDTLFVPDGAAYKNFDLPAIFLSLRANGLEYLPVRDLTYALDCALWGSNPAGFHLTNLLWYWLTVAAAYFFTLKLARQLQQQESDCATENAPRTLALVTSAIFAVHPLHSEVVSFITCRNALVSAGFFFLSCIAWLHYLTGPQRRRLFYMMALFCFVCSVFAKATGIVLPLILLCLTWLVCRRFTKQHLAALLPFFLVCGGVFVLFTEIARHTDIFLRQPFSANIGDKITLAAQIPLFYLGKLLVPFPLSADYGTSHFATALAAPRVIFSLLFLAAMAAVIWLFHRKYPLPAFAGAWFLIAMIPVLHLFPTLPVVADRYAYIPSFGFSLLIAVIGTALCGRRLWIAAVPVLAILAVLACRQNLVWKNDKTLWEKTLAVSPNSTTALAELGRIYFREERNLPRAMEMYRRASEVDPADPALDLFMGHVFMMRRDFPNATAAFRQATERNPENIEAALNLGRAYESAGSLDRAKEQYLRATTLPELDPRADMRGRAAGYLQRLQGP